MERSTSWFCRSITCVAALMALSVAAAAQADGRSGGRGAVLLDRRYVEPGSVDETGPYNHYSALRSYEDVLGIKGGGTDGVGHLGYAASLGLEPFARDVVNAQRFGGWGY